MSKNFSYSILYWDRMLRQNSGTAQFINAIRWHFLREVNPKIVLDYGSGPGWFRAFAPERIEVDTFDPSGWPQTGIRHKTYDLITFWDVLEHIPDLSVIKPFLFASRFLATSLPILPKGKDFKTWKHNKPGEHINVFTKNSLKHFLEKHNFQLIKDGDPESCIREDIYTALFENSKELIPLK